jgi:hypothetical protein
MNHQSSIIYRPSSVFMLYFCREHSTAVERALQIHPFMQNKPNYSNDKMNINLDMISNYKNLSHWRGPKNKANSNPIQTQLKPKQTQFKPNQSQSVFYRIVGP